MSDSPPERGDDTGNSGYKLPSEARRRDLIRQATAKERERRQQVAEWRSQAGVEETGEDGRERKIIPLTRQWGRVWIGIAAALVVGVSIWIMSRPKPEGGIMLVAKRERGGKVELPVKFSLNAKSRQLELSEGGDRLAGSIEPLTAESSSRVAAFNVRLFGKDTAGNEGRFQGKLWLTNTAGVTIIRKQTDVTGARMRGSFEISGKITNGVDQVFVPQLP